MRINVQYQKHLGEKTSISFSKQELVSTSHTRYLKNV